MVTDPNIRARLIAQAKEDFAQGRPPGPVPGAESGRVWFDAELRDHRVDLTFGFPPGVRYFVYADGRAPGVSRSRIGEFFVVAADESGFVLRAPVGFVGRVDWLAIDPQVRRRNAKKMLDKNPLKWLHEEVSP